MIPTAALGVVIWTLAFIAGWLIAQWIGIVVVGVFFALAATLGVIEEND